MERRGAAAAAAAEGCSTHPLVHLLLGLQRRLASTLLSRRLRGLATRARLGLGRIGRRCRRLLRAAALLVRLVLGADSVRLDKGRVSSAPSAQIGERSVGVGGVVVTAHGEGLGEVAVDEPLGDLRLAERPLHVALQVAVEPLLGRLGHGRGSVVSRIARIAAAAAAAVVVVAAGRVARSARLLPAAVAAVRVARLAAVPVAPPAAVAVAAPVALAAAIALAAALSLAPLAAAALAALEASTASAALSALGVAHNNRVQPQLLLVRFDGKERQRNEDLWRRRVRHVLEFVGELGLLEAAILVDLEHLIFAVREAFGGRLRGGRKWGSTRNA